MALAPGANRSRLNCPVPAVWVLRLIGSDMPKILRMAGTDLVWELEDSVDLTSRAGEIETARASNQFVTLRARLPGQTEFSHLTLAPGQLAWWSLGEENNPSAMGWGR
jgi:hypothetical protein